MKTTSFRDYLEEAEAKDPGFKARVEQETKRLRQSINYQKDRNMSRKFMHFRYPAENQPGGVATRGGLTVAFDEVEGEVEYAVAKCHKRDNFCRANGRNIASHRLERWQHGAQVFSGDRDAFVAYIEDLMFRNPEELGGPLIRKFGKNNRKAA